MLAQKSLQGDGRGELSGTNQLRGDVENPPVHLLGKCSGLRKSETRSKASLLTRIAPSSACSASILCGARRNVGSGSVRLQSGSYREIVDCWHGVSRPASARGGRRISSTVIFLSHRGAAKGGNFGLAERAHAIHTAKKFRKINGWTGRDFGAVRRPPCAYFKSLALILRSAQSARLEGWAA